MSMHVNGFFPPENTSTNFHHTVIVNLVCKYLNMCIWRQQKNKKLACGISSLSRGSNP